MFPSQNTPNSLPQFPFPLPLQMWTSTPSSNPNPFSSPSTFAAILDNEAPSSNSRLQKNMEDVWKDISLSSLQYNHPSSRGMILLDFFSSDPPPAAAAAVPPPPPPPPPTQLPMPAMLTLSSGRDQTGNSLVDQPILSNGAHHNLQFDDLVPDQHNAAGVGKKRFSESQRNSGDRRNKRMIKNRESAARSRARKQAYTNELELEVAHLLEENARLKKQQQQSYEAAEYHQHSNKKPLYRTSTAPF